MKADLTALAIRWLLAFFLFSLVALFLYLSGAAQSFLEQTLAELFLFVRWSSWIGLILSWLLLVPLTRKRLRRLSAAVALGAGFTVLFAFVLFWASWVYPGSGAVPW